MDASEDHRGQGSRKGQKRRASRLRDEDATSDADATKRPKTGEPSGPVVSAAFSSHTPKPNVAQTTPGLDVPPITSQLGAAPIDVPSPVLSDYQVQLYAGLQERLSAQTQRQAFLRGKPLLDAKMRCLGIMASIGIACTMSDEHMVNFSSGNLEFDLDMLEAYGQNASVILNGWEQKPTKLAQLDVSGRSEETKAAQRLVKQWYHATCILSGAKGPGVQMAHIVPDYVLRNEARRIDFWSALAMFWPRSVVIDLSDILKVPENVRVNLLPLDIGIHDMLSRGEIAFRPLPPGPDRTLSVQFFWVKKQATDNQIISYEQSERGIVDARTPPNQGYRRCLQTGEVITLTTCDPETFPLPSRGLLELQWALGRALRASAAAENLELFFHGGKGGGGAAAPVRVEEEEEDDGRHYEERPFFAEYLITEALEQGILTATEAAEWREALVTDESSGEWAGVDGPATSASPGPQGRRLTEGRPRAQSADIEAAYRWYLARSSTFPRPL